MPGKIKNYLSESVNRQKIIGMVILLIIIPMFYFIAFKGYDVVFGIEKKQDGQPQATLRINEYVVRNSATLRDGDWNSPDWIELLNYGDNPVWLGDIYLSDDIEDPEKFLLPDAMLMPGEYLVVLASGKTETQDGYVRAPFKLGEDDENILLFGAGEIIDMVEIAYLPQNISAGYGQDGRFGYFGEPTPGAENAPEMYDSMDIQPSNPYENMLIINEYLPGNRYSITDFEGAHSDWIELYNPNDYAVYLGDIYLSDDENRLNKFRLPETDLAGGGYILIFASEKTTGADGEIHAPFKIGAGDKKIILTYKTGHIINQCGVEDLPDGVSAGIAAGGAFGYFSQPTPGGENNTPQFATPDIGAEYEPESPLLINEWMTNNEYGILDEDGDSSDWVELYNPSTEDICLCGYSLTDDIGRPFKWEFPEDAEIPANGYILVYTSGKDRSGGGRLHTNFSLSEGETLYLMEPNSAIADFAEVEALPGNVSKGRTEEGYGYFSLPTPGSQNTCDYVTGIKDGTSFLLSDVYISEVASGRYHYYRSRSKGIYEYIELFNSGGQAVDLTGYELSENGNEKYVFEGGAQIAPGGYLLVALKGYAPQGDDTVFAAGLSLNSAGERLLFKNADDVIIDCFDTGYLLGDYSSGRTSEKDSSRVFFMEKTPGGKNSEEIYTSYASKPVFSHEGGMCGGGFLLSISAESDCTIYYTLNGNIPTEDSKMYTESFFIDKDTVVRAVAVTEGKLPSLIETRTYILERKHDIPVVCLTSPPGGLFYDLGGIYANGPGYGVGEYPYFESNYFMNVERPVAFEYYTEEGKAAVEFDAGIQIAGGYTRVVPQKSLVVRLRDEYGLSEVNYPFFEEGVGTFRHLLLRNAGQDGWKTKVRDSFIQNCAAELGTVDMKRGRPVAVYINGEYWGLYNLRDKLNDEYLAIKYDIEQDDINILTEYSAVKKGDNKDWLKLRDFCLSSNMRTQENYEYLAAKVDVQAFMDYIIIQTFFGNVDTHNINFWKADTEGAKWRPLLFDMDLSVRGVDYSMVNMYLGRSDLGFDSFVIKSLAKNATFQEEFLERYSYVLGNVFTQEYLTSELDLLEEEISHEMVYHLQRWDRPSSMEYWKKCMDVFREGLISRRYEAVEELKDYFGLDDGRVEELFPWYSAE